MPRSRAALIDHLELARQQETTLTDWSNVNWLRALAAPALDRDGSAIAAISVAAPAMRLTREAFLAEVRIPLMT